jgi:DNA-binding NarL/FixJ family response regulator
MKKIRIGLIDDHNIVREGFKSLLHSDPQFDVCLEAVTGEHALELIKENNLDLIITDITMPEMNGIELCKKVKDFGIKVPVIILSMHNNKEYLLKAFNAGASGYLVKDCDRTELFFAIHKVLNGGTYFGEAITLAMLEKYAYEDQQPNIVYNGFTKREKQIVNLLKAGESTKSIANTLFISPRTVDKHRANMMEKVGVHNVIDLLNYLASPLNNQ